jgi:hypothetical protein
MTPFILYKIIFSTHEGTFSTGQSLLSADSVHKVDPNEVWRIFKGWVLLALLLGVIAILLEF